MNDLLAGDHHVHSTFSDDAVSTLEQNLAAAEAAGITTLGFADHVRRDTTWIPEYLTAISRLRVPGEIRVLTGVEAKILDAKGTLDIPRIPAGIDRILIADHQFPGARGPLSPAEVRARINDGWAHEDVLDEFTSAVMSSMRRYPGNQLAHCFSLLPKIGLAESELGHERLNAWARCASETGTLVEVNEKWQCPGPSSLAVLRREGVEIVASTDSHVARDIGRYVQVPSLLMGAMDEVSNE